MALRKNWKAQIPPGGKGGNGDESDAQEVGNPDAVAVLKELDAAIREAEKAQEENG
ncbi:MAG TPA: hypothetical protein VD862_03780 [Candidatus Paceibacterota bacterium]|nr:hypothetical protein [Candidatus Paceibacterota bacterium]